MTFRGACLPEQAYYSYLQGLVKHVVQPTKHHAPKLLIALEKGKEKGQKLEGRVGQSASLISSAFHLQFLLLSEPQASLSSHLLLLVHLLLADHDGVLQAFEKAAHGGDTRLRCRRQPLDRIIPEKRGRGRGRKRQDKI